MRWLCFLFLFAIAGCHPRQSCPQVPKGPVAATHDAEQRIGSTMNWALVLGLVGIAASVAAGFWVGWTIAKGGIAGFGALVALSITVQLILPWLIWAALAMLLCIMGLVLWEFRNRLKVLHELAQDDDKPLTPLAEKVVAKLKK